MAQDTKIVTGAQNAACDGIVDLVDAGAGPGTLEVRTGPPPASANDVDSGTLLATLTFSATAYGAAVGGVATAAAITSATAVASGDAGHFREKDSDGNVVKQGTAGELADDPNLTFDNKSIVGGGTVGITALTHTVNES